MPVSRKTNLKRGVFQYKRGAGLQLRGPLEILNDVTQTGAVVPGALTVAGSTTFTGGTTPTQTALTATVDGLTTGLITTAAGFLAVTSGNSAHIITLPASAPSLIGKRYTGRVGANGCKVRTPATSNATINNVDADGTAQATLPANTTFIADLVATDTWIVSAYNNVGAAITIAVA